MKYFFIITCIILPVELFASTCATQDETLPLADQLKNISWIKNCKDANGIEQFSVEKESGTCQIQRETSPGSTISSVALCASTSLPVSVCAKKVAFKPTDQDDKNGSDVDVNKKLLRLARRNKRAQLKAQHARAIKNMDRNFRKYIAQKESTTCVNTCAIL